MRIIPITEFWPARYLALLAGLPAIRSGSVGRPCRWKWDFDAAYSHSMNPSTNFAGYLMPLNKLHFGVTRSGNFIGK
jgi:hypothetical protein